MPPDPFSSSGPGLSVWAANIRDMYTSLLAAGFKEPEALEITVNCVRIMTEKAIS